MNIVVLDGYALNPGDLSWDGLKQLGNVSVFDRTPYTDDDIIRNTGDAEIIFTNKTPLNRTVLSKLKTVKFIGVLATGYNVVDTVAAREYGITVTNVPAYSTDSVAQMTFALLLELCLHAGAHSDAVFKGEWTSCDDFCFWKYPLVELSGKTIGIIGFGRIGQAVARIAAAFGMKVTVHTRTRRDISGTGYSFTSLEELLKDSDVVSLHCPLTDETKGMINSQSIGKMKDGSFLINTSRGGLIVEADVRDALNNGKLAGAGVDVVSVEPIKADNPLLKAKNCIITPHIAWAPLEARKRLMNITVSNLKAYLEGREVNVVNR
ncbi:MAG: D-2-hydroxyacid dehydrogenase [Methanosarcina sp.]